MPLLHGLNNFFKKVKKDVNSFRSSIILLLGVCWKSMWRPHAANWSNQRYTYYAYLLFICSILFFFLFFSFNISWALFYVLSLEVWLKPNLSHLSLDWWVHCSRTSCVEMCTCNPCIQLWHRVDFFSSCAIDSSWIGHGFSLRIPIFIVF